MLEDITILIPTFHRRGYLKDCLEGISANLPECKVVVASDDGLLPEFSGWTGWSILPYDSGVNAKRNACVGVAPTRYCLLGSDDFDFSTPEVREGIIKLVRALKSSEINIGLEIDVAAGRVDNKPYEGYLEYIPGQYIKEHRIGPRQASKVTGVDLAVNYFLARTSVLREIPWDENIKPTGGDHVDFFLDLKAAGKKVVFVPDVNINQMPYDASKQHPSYPQFRRRCWDGHALMMKKRNIKKYYGFDEDVQPTSILDT